MTVPSPEDIVESCKRDPRYGYDGRLQKIRQTEYSHLGDTIYFDHAGATPYPISVIQDHTKDLTTNLFSNPHSRSPSSVATTARIESIRRRILELFNANAELFDVVFVANATAGIKLVADGFSGGNNGFRYTYLRDAHTSLVGVAGLAKESSCLTQREVEVWLSNNSERETSKPGLFAFPAQSNLNGLRFPLSWIPRIRQYPGWYTLLDAASYLTTTPLDFSDPSLAPDFTVLSFYKIFGYPDLGAIIVKRDAGHILLQRRYFGGGTRAAITADSFHAPRKQLHEALEDGTLPFHAILALDSCFRNFTRLFGSHINISRHAAVVTQVMYTLLSSLKHYNRRSVCQIYSSPDQGPVIAFNLFSADGSPIGFASFEKLTSLRNIALRTGGMCNPGGVEQYLDLQNWEVERNFRKGKVCGDDHDVVEGKNTGVIRVSFGASSSIEEVCSFVDFVREFYVEKESHPMEITQHSVNSITLQSINIYPIKSCHAYSVPEGVEWPVTPHGLLFDREFFLISTTSGRALSQKQYPRMALIRPSVNLSTRTMSISSPSSPGQLEIAFDIDIPQSLAMGTTMVRENARLCGDTIRSLVFTSPRIRDFFSAIIGVECSLAMYHPDISDTMRFFKPHLSGSKSSITDACATKREIWLSNESPFLLISQSSVETLSLSTTSKTPIPSAVFRANFVVNGSTAYLEDTFKRLRIGSAGFDVLGQCRRCHMVCVDPERGIKEKEGGEIYLSLGKTRRKDTGGVVFGIHMGLNVKEGFVQIGDSLIVEETQ